MAIAAMISVGAAQPAEAVTIQWKAEDGGNNHWYQIVLGRQTWQQADAAAQATSVDGQIGYLATITSAAEQAFLNSLNPSNANLWLGGSDEETEGLWRWVRGPEAGTLINSGFTNWAPGEPNDYGPGEDYLQGWWNGTRWNDLRTSWTHLNNGYVIEYDEAPIPVPLPAGLPLVGASLLALAGLRLRRKHLA